VNILLTVSESDRLEALEQTIKDGQKTFVAVGRALAEIRDRKLYKAQHKNFEEYCRERWQWTKQHAYRLIECAPIAESNPQVTSINQARELAKVAEEKRAQVVEIAATKAEAEERPMTARDIRESAAPTPPRQPIVSEVTQTTDVEAKVLAIDDFAELYGNKTPFHRGEVILWALLSNLRVALVADKQRYRRLFDEWLTRATEQKEAARA
jgi:hypothetical protein